VDDVTETDVLVVLLPGTVLVDVRLVEVVVVDPTTVVEVVEVVGTLVVLVEGTVVGVVVLVVVVTVVDVDVVDVDVDDVVATDVLVVVPPATGASMAPASHTAPAVWSPSIGRTTSRWSTVGGGQVSTASIAGLPARSAWLAVPSPASARAPSSGSTPL